MNLRHLVDNTVRSLLLAAIVIYFVTGYGITEFRTVESLTFGLLTKNLAFRIHNALAVPLIVLLFLHVVLPSVLRYFGGKRSQPVSD